MDIKQIKDQLISELKSVNLKEEDVIFFNENIQKSLTFESLSYYFDIYKFSDKLKKLFISYNFVLNNS